MPTCSCLCSCLLPLIPVVVVEIIIQLDLFALCCQGATNVDVVVDLLAADGIVLSGPWMRDDDRSRRLVLMVLLFEVYRLLMSGCPAFRSLDVQQLWVIPPACVEGVGTLRLVLRQLLLMSSNFLRSRLLVLLDRRVRRYL